eukprot:CAMPEP_0197033124 /NCGR_PEP_ID=MMETSP1384-20130603/11616_1 /TAXON_ID=29189 /ORGANISM="Ammonia sp." /LENGTH=295 /DNA_ID=CAMNT_0042462885 /DNA_START=26 /DNA_END=913 /DNA_ORIENTATION=-
MSDVENAPPAKKRKLNDLDEEEMKSKPKKEKKKFAKPFGAKAMGYVVGDFQLMNTARCEFKALFGMNRLTVAWSDVTSSDVRQCFQGGGGLFGAFDFGGYMNAANLMKNMQTFRVEIDINNIECIQISDGGAATRLDIVTNAIPMFSKQTNSGCGKGNKFAKSEDPTNGNAVKYKRHRIYLSKKPTLSNMQQIESRLKSGSERLKQLIDDEVYRQYEEVTMEDMHDENALNAAKSSKPHPDKKQKATGKKKKAEKQQNNISEDNANKKKKAKSTRKRKREQIPCEDSDDDSDWKP